MQCLSASRSLSNRIQDLSCAPVSETFEVMKQHISILKPSYCLVPVSVNSTISQDVSEITQLTNRQRLNIMFQIN